MKSGAIKLTSTSDEGTTGNFEVKVLEGRAACGGPRVVWGVEVAQALEGPFSAVAKPNLH